MSDLVFIFSRLNYLDVFDILLVASVFFWILALIQGTQAVQLLRGVLLLSVLAAIAAGAFEQLTAFSWLIDRALPALLVAIPVIFQPELRRALERVGRTGGKLAAPRQPNPLAETIKAVAAACVVLSQKRYGALIVFERETGLADHIETGIPLDATVTADLIQTIFFPNTPLHDGGIIIRENRVVAASVVLPLGTLVEGQGQQLGTRHLAALGISQVSDAVAVIVSEETGLISIAHDGNLIRGLDRKRLEQLLVVFFKKQLVEHIAYPLRTGQELLKRFGLGKTDDSSGQSD